ncbi:Gfo/Idh/MocA family protein [Roseomonas xinghualingensis]|uniref:Gfo/Idh/MocA family protein n=1 Tax=Roseomonas xinghualingensis TaxID=2986475 RepID=UPI0021F19A38|nr:Gfo/Idh/MocA family oxidoreductase [Roseomonas sp. SXEYE001]MCV4208552.1 Gfo/Idh/MocA family oxidoreductase [Roseomonas sp. SXEYE001]
MTAVISSKGPPRLGFLGVGWIGRHRMQAILATGAAEAAAICDPSPEMAAEAQKLAPGAKLVDSLEEMLSLGLDGVVIATPSAMHAAQSIQALTQGAAVFCQKPLGRTATEVRAVVAAARAADRLLEVDLSYRFTEGMRRIREAIRAGELGSPYAIDLVFHNAYGPDKPWFRDPALSGGGCVMDLGVHLVDLALWALDFPRVARVSGSLFAGGEPLAGRTDRVEDYAVATIELETGAVVRLACSWNLHAGCDAVIAADFHGTSGGAALRNVNGSFYDFTAERFHGTSRETLAVPPDEWGGRAAAGWALRLAGGTRFDPVAEQLVTVSEVLDRIYGRQDPLIPRATAEAIAAPA